MPGTSKLCEEETLLRASIAASQHTPPPLPCSPPPPLTPPNGSIGEERKRGRMEQLICRLKIAAEGSTKSAASGNSNSIASADIEDSTKNVVYERKSPSRSEGKPPSSPKENPFDKLPWLVMYRIFDTLELKQRAQASMVCKRWNSLLTDGRFPLGDVAVLNIFERTVWENTLSQNAGAKVQCVRLQNWQELPKVLSHCSTASSVKIWYMTTEFARKTLERIRERGMKMRSMDVYPYSEHVGMELFHEYLPDLGGMTMRPHAQNFFFSGLDLPLFPRFEKLDTLHLDCINLGEESQLPGTITTLEWQNRNDAQFRLFMRKMNRLPRLEYLLLGHVDFKGTDFADFIEMIGRRKMHRLQYLLFKFVKLEALDLPEVDSASNSMEVLGRLRFLKFDLCYGDVKNIVNRFLTLTGPELRIISLNIISDESQPTFSDLFGWISERMRSRSVSLHLGLLQRDSIQKIPGEYAKPSADFEHILSKFEASFVTDPALTHALFSLSCRYHILTEIKFIQCNAVTDGLLESIANNCLQLRKLSLLSCNECSESGIRQFVEKFHLRHSPVLQIVWKRDRRANPRPANFFLNLINEYSHLLKGLKYRFLCKQFNETNNGEAVLIWLAEKMLQIQDYDEFDRNRILGIILPGTL